jgi:hypothetical protein
MQEQVDIVLDLQKLEVPEEEVFFGNSGGSSIQRCCNDPK